MNTLITLSGVRKHKIGPAAVYSDIAVVKNIDLGTYNLQRSDKIMEFIYKQFKTFGYIQVSCLKSKLDKIALCQTAKEKEIETYLVIKEEIVGKILKVKIKKDAEQDAYRFYGDFCYQSDTLAAKAFKDEVNYVSNAVFSIGSKCAKSSNSPKEETLEVFRLFIREPEKH